MIDSSTKKPLCVSTAGDASPYIMLPVEQVDEVRALLDAHDISYWVDEHAISIDGEPEVTVVNLGRDVDPDAVQSILDGAKSK